MIDTIVKANFCVLFLLSFPTQHIVGAFQPIGCPSFRDTAPSSLHSVPTPLDTLTSGLASICRLPRGVTVDTAAKSSAGIQLELYDVENSQACRAVRERITELDLVIDRVIPATSDARCFVETGNPYSLPTGTTIPCLKVTPPNGDERLQLQGAENILAYLDKAFSFKQASQAQQEGEEEDGVVLEEVLDKLRAAGGVVASVLRSGRGSEVSGAASFRSTGVPRPSKPLVLYSYEGNQFCRLVREIMTELDLVYELRSAGKESPRRQELASITGGSTQCPFLIDPNTGTQMAESADIIEYLYSNYAIYVPPNGILRFASDKVLPLAQPVLHYLARWQAGKQPDDSAAYDQAVSKAKAEVESEIGQEAIVLYTYALSPFSTETLALLDKLGLSYKQVSLGQEWIPGLLSGAAKRAALLEMTGQSSLPHIFINGQSIGGLFSGTPGLIPALEKGELKRLLRQ